MILVKDLETVQDFQSIYKVGKVVRTSKNKLDRLTLKSSVIYHHEREPTKTESAEKELQIRTLYNQIKSQQKAYNV